MKRAVLLRSDDEPGQLVVRVFVEAADDEGLAGWQRAHQAGIEEFRRELSLRLPSAWLLEFTYGSPGGSPGDEPGAARIGVPDDGSLAAEQLSGREIVTKAMELLRANYVFPDQAERAAAAIEARLEAGEYDGLDEITLTDQVTIHLQDITGDKHLRLRLGGGPGPRREPAKRPNREKMRKMGRLDNFGIRRVERLNGNVGYIDLRRMPDPANAGPAISAAMELVAGTTRSSSTCGTTAAGRRRAWSSGAATCSTASRPTSTTSSGPTPARPGSSGRCPTCPGPATRTSRSTC